MEFGKVEGVDLGSIDYTLPGDSKRTKAVLKQSGFAGKTEIYIGCAKWGRPDWVGKIYPPKTKAADFLEHYARHFNSIELNATFYKMPDRQTVSNWKSRVGPGFKFAPKFTDVITHIRRLRNVSDQVGQFLDGIDAFGETLGPIFLMPHPQLAPKGMETLVQFVDALPKDIELFLELRHPAWFATDEGRAIFDVMEERGKGMVITDASGRRDCVHMELTTPTTFIRFVGNSLHPTDYERIDLWVQRLKQWMKGGLQRLYFYMHQHEELYSPELIRYTIEQLNKECKLNIPVPQFYTPDLLAKPTPAAKAAPKKKAGQGKLL